MKNMIHYFQNVRSLNRNARLFLLHTLLSGLSLALLSLLYNLYILSLGFQQDMIGTVTLIACLVGVAAALPGGYVLNRLGYRRTLSVSVALTALSIMVPLVVPTSAALIGTELFWGIGFTWLVIAGGPFMTENSTDAQRGHLFSVQFVLATLTAFAGNLVGGGMPRWFGAWLGLNAESPQAYQGVLWVSALLMLAAAVPFWFIRAGGAGAPVGLRARPRLTLRNRALAIRILTPHILGAFAAGMIVPFANVLWRMSYQLADATIGNIFALSALLMALFGLVSPLLTARLGRVRVMIMVQGLAIVGLLAFGFAPLLGFAVAGFLTRDILLNWMRPLYGQFMMELSDPAERAAVSAWATMGFNLAWGVSSWISGELQSAGELAWVFGGSACVALGALVAFARFFGTGETPRAREVLAHPFGVSAE